jgi:hypothetical protein
LIARHATSESAQAAALFGWTRDEALGRDLRAAMSIAPIAQVGTTML